MISVKSYLDKTFGLKINWIKTIFELKKHLWIQKINFNLKSKMSFRYKIFESNKTSLN